MNEQAKTSEFVRLLDEYSRECAHPFDPDYASIRKEAREALINYHEAQKFFGTQTNKSERVREILKDYFWIEGLETNTRYRRLHDDHDGTFQGHLSVVFSEDGDAWVTTGDPDALRFRMPMIGGGMSRYTRCALMILAEAIRMDSKELPQTRLLEVDRNEDRTERVDRMAADRQNELRLVPVKPTPTMIAVGACRDEQNIDSYPDEVSAVKGIYTRMINASPPILMNHDPSAVIPQATADKLREKFYSELDHEKNSGAE